MSHEAPATFSVFGATGQTGRHFVSLAIKKGHRVRTLARNPAKLGLQSPDLEIHQGSVTNPPDLDGLVRGSDFVICMLGDVELQKDDKINTAFVKKLVPAMRRHDVKRLLYQAGGLSKPPGESLPPLLWTIRNTLGRAYNGQHEDNEAVMEYLIHEAADVEWMVHRAGIGSDAGSRGVLHRSKKQFSVATFEDCATYNYHLLHDPTAIHTCDLSSYREG